MVAWCEATGRPCKGFLIPKCEEVGGLSSAHLLAGATKPAANPALAERTEPGRPEVLRVGHAQEPESPTRRSASARGMWLFMSCTKAPATRHNPRSRKTGAVLL